MDQRVSDQSELGGLRTHTPGGKSSVRVGSVWGDARKEPTSRASPEPPVMLSPGRKRLDENRARRREAAEWIEMVTGVPLPYGEDLDFRKALRDGTLLCRVLNIVCPGARVKVIESGAAGEHIQRWENVQTFLQHIKNMGVPTDNMFNLADLEYDKYEGDRPRVADCILWLKRLHTGHAGHSPGSMLGNDVIGAVDSPHKHMLSARSAAAMGIPSFQLPSPEHHQLAPVAHAAPRMGPTSPAGQLHSARSLGPSYLSTSGVTHLMQQCTVMLQQRMYSFTDMQTSSSMQLAQQQQRPPDFNLEALGPVLEQVLGGLTSEYERRLLQKDQEIHASKERIALAQRQLIELQDQVDRMRVELDRKTQQAVLEAQAMTYERSAEVEEELHSLRQTLQEREQQYERARQQLEGQSREEEERLQQVESELEEARRQIADQQYLQDNYRSIQEENKKLYNMVQDLKGSIRVFCRIRPPAVTGDNTDACVDFGENELAIYDHAKAGAPKTFKFDRVFGWDTNQEQIYEDTQPLIRSVLDGYNVCIFAYGQTGSGKTHTMTGTNVHLMEGRGINYRALDDLFAIREQRSHEVVYTIKAQMVEVYNETLRDLLSGDQGERNRLEIMNTQGSGCNVKGAVQVEVSTTEDVLRMMDMGKRNRHHASTNMNERSSRSHQVLTIIVDGHNQMTQARSFGCLHLVDLAGSERVEKSGATGERLTEAKYINSSLSALGDVMAALAKKASHVPFRNSKLTELLQDSLSGQAKVMMFMHIAPEGSSFNESISTLRFANRVAEITLGQAKKNVESGDVVKAHEEIHKLKGATHEKDRRIEQLNHKLLEEQREKAQLADELRRVKHQLEAAKSFKVVQDPLSTPLGEAGHRSRLSGLQAESSTPQAAGRPPVTPLSAASFASARSGGVYGGSATTPEPPKFTRGGIPSFSASRPPAGGSMTADRRLSLPRAGTGSFTMPSAMQPLPKTPSAGRDTDGFAVPSPTLASRASVNATTAAVNLRTSSASARPSGVYQLARPSSGVPDRAAAPASASGSQTHRGSTGTRSASTAPSSDGAAALEPVSRLPSATLQRSNSSTRQSMSAKPGATWRNR